MMDVATILAVTCMRGGSARRGPTLLPRTAQAEAHRVAEQIRRSFVAIQAMPKART
ncbi:hypothetical protein GCM10010994_02280 [Chelatococcus reniformis]|uniref:Uncharacterized protein n=1 Tax=Chelatococcus reniformis TaxID=1494448 RepID=A0A916TXX2_9HYPH|nr:hypothetical protein GCM10010994_02280 [Chelatococcus reniformis]